MAVAGGLRVAEARRVNCDNRTYLEVTLANDSASLVGPGGLRMTVERSHGSPLGVSISNHWPLAPGAAVFLTTFLPNESLKHVDLVDYIGVDGEVHALGDRLSIGWFFSELKRGMIGADVEA